MAEAIAAYEAATEGADREHTITLHMWNHIAQQIRDIGPCRDANMFMSEGRNRHIKESAKHSKRHPVAVVMHQQARVHRNMGLNNELMRHAGLSADNQLREEAAAQRAHGIGNGVQVQLDDKHIQELRLWCLHQASEADAATIRRCIPPHTCAICMRAGRTTVCVLPTHVLLCAHEKGSSLLCSTLAPCVAPPALICLYKRAASSRSCHLLQGLPAGEGPQPACQRCRPVWLAATHLKQ